MPARCIYSRRFPFNFLSLDSSFIRASPTISTFSPPLLFHKAIHLFILSLARSHCTACGGWVTAPRTSRSETGAAAERGEAPARCPHLRPQSPLLPSPPYSRASPLALHLRQQPCAPQAAAPGSARSRRAEGERSPRTRSRDVAPAPGCGQRGRGLGRGRAGRGSAVPQRSRPQKPGGGRGSPGGRRAPRREGSGVSRLTRDGEQDTGSSICALWY